MNLDRSQLNLSSLRTNSQFNALLEALRAELTDAREAYEGEPASEFNRGRVIALRELIDGIAGNLGTHHGTRR